MASRRMKPYGNLHEGDKTEKYYDLNKCELEPEYKLYLFRHGTGSQTSFCCSCLGSNPLQGIAGCAATAQEAYNDRQERLR